MSLSARDLAKTIGDARIVAGDQIASLMGASDLEVMGVVYNFVSDPAKASIIAPPLSQENVYSFLRTYFRRCIEENPKSEWADSRYSACWDTANWLKSIWDSLDAGQRHHWKDWLSDMYLQNDAAVRTAIETGILEHAFVDKKIVESFADWKSRPELEEAYRISLPVTS